MMAPENVQKPLKLIKGYAVRRTLPKRVPGAYFRLLTKTIDKKTYNRMS